MVKLRGINLFPTGIGALLVEAAPGATGEFLCRVTRARTGGMRWRCILRCRARHRRRCATRLEELLRTRLGVEVAVVLEAPGALAPLTQVEQRQKAIRLLDERA